MTPRKKIAGVRTPDDANETHSAPHEGLQPDDLSDDVNKVLAELGESASQLVIYRMKDHKPGEWDYVTRISASEFTLEYLKEQFGGGEYKIVIIDGTQGALNPIMVSIDRRFAGKLFAGSPPTIMQNGGDQFKDRLLEILLAKALTPAAPPPPSDDFDKFLKLAVIFKEGGNGGGMSQMKDMFDMARSLAESMHPPEGLAGVAASFLPVISRMVPESNNAPAPAPRRLPATTPVTHTVNPQPTTAPVTLAPPAQVAGSITPSWLAPFKSLAPMLVTLADRGSDPTVYADVAIDSLQDDEATFTAAVEAMNENRLLADLLSIAPALEKTEKRKEFAAQLVSRIEEALRDMLANPEEEDDAAANA